MKKDKKETRFKRKINAICIDFRFYSKVKKKQVIDPCLEEYRKKVSSGLSEKEAAILICNGCKLALEQKYEKHNKFLSLLLFSFVICLFAFTIEFFVFNNTFYDNPKALIIWCPCVIGVLIVFVIWAGLTHNGRWFGYFFLALYMLVWASTMAIVIYFTYFNLGSYECIRFVRFDFNSELLLEIRQTPGVLTDLGSCNYGNFSAIRTHLFNPDTCCSLALFVICSLFYLVEHARLNTYYCRNKINNLCTQYGIVKKEDRKEIRDGAYTKYYAYLDQGLTKKQANELVLSEITEILSKDHKKHNRLLFSFVVVLIFFVIGVLEYGLCYQCFVGHSYNLTIIFILPVVDAFILAITFIAMCGDHGRHYWYEFIIIFIMFISVIAMEISVVLVDSGHFDPPNAGQITYEVGPFYIKQIMERFEDTLTEEGWYEYNPNVIVSTSYDYGIMYDTIVAIILAVIIIPIYSVCQHRINKERKTLKL